MQNYLDLTGKVAIVTGAGSGIGFATGIALSACGAAVAINFHRNESGATALRNQIVEAGGRAIRLQADVTASDEVERLVRKTIDEFGGVDILVNNAGSLIERQRIRELTERRWDEVISLNLTSAFLCSKAVVPLMIEKRSGSIINLTSIA